MLFCNNKNTTTKTNIKHNIKNNCKANAKAKMRQKQKQIKFLIANTTTTNLVIFIISRRVMLHHPSIDSFNCEHSKDPLLRRSFSQLKNVVVLKRLPSLFLSTLTNTMKSFKFSEFLSPSMLLEHYVRKFAFKSKVCHGLLPKQNAATIGRIGEHFTNSKL